MEEAGRWPLKIPLIVSAVLGGFFGAFLRVLAQVSFSKTSPSLVSGSASLVMTLGFLALGPFAIGYITVAVAESACRRRVYLWFIVPWVGVALSMLISWLLDLEGLICIVFAVPIAMFFSSLGGLSAGIVVRTARRRRAVTTACVVLLPFLVAPAESRFQPPLQHRLVQTEIRIHAPDTVVWSNIERVRPIAPAELRPTWAHLIGFPRPVEATLSYEGIGGVRHASFEHGLLFVETVTQWQPDRILAFSIRADTADIPPTTLDEHVTIGGRYFDVLNGEYRLEDVGGGDILLHLSSEERLSTDFNGYAGFWSDAVMRSLQNSILEVLKTRCEQAVSVEP